MNNLKRHFFLLLVISMHTVYGQKYFYKTYNWEKEPTVYKPTEKESTADLILVKDYNVLEVAYDKDGQAVIYETNHVIYHVNKHSAVTEVNKIYISTRGVNEELDLKARCITANNKIIPINADNIKRVDNLENSGPYTIFTIDGVDVGCDVEYYYTNKQNYYSYTYIKIQSKTPIVKYNMNVLSPKNLVYETKCYNGLNDFVKDESDSTKNILRLERSNIPEITEEDYSSVKANKLAFSLQLAYNTDKGKAKIFTWETIAKGYYNNLFLLEDSEKKAVAKLIDKNKINKLATPEEKIRALENLIKLQYNVSEEGTDLEFVKALDKKILSEVYALRLYIEAFRIFDVPFELIITSDRSNRKFDSKYPSYSFLDDILFSFPTLNKYTSPTDVLSRIGYPNHYNIASEGLFLKEIMVGDIGAPSSKIKQISGNDYLSSYHNLAIKVNINPTSLVTNLDVVQTLAGYQAYYIQPVYNLLSAEQKLDVGKNYFTIKTPNTTKNVVISNVNTEDILVKPMQISYTQELSDLIESAGNKFILKVGDLIGPQSELYSDKKRVSDGDIYSSHYLKRDIEINIPEGYKIVNADEIKINKKCIIDGKEVAQFTSDYKIEGNKIIITVYEDYRVVIYPLEHFEGFKDVINAAADFNKKTLIFDKK